MGTDSGRASLGSQKATPMRQPEASPRVFLNRLAVGEHRSVKSDSRLRASVKDIRFQGDPTKRFAYVCSRCG
jgi:hypothetical protein